MSRVDRDQMTTLRPAADAYQTSLTAEDEIQLEAVAYAINNASNTGEVRVVFQTPLRPNVESQLKSNGYTIRLIGIAELERQTLISWSPVSTTKEGD